VAPHTMEGPMSDAPIPERRRGPDRRSNWTSATTETGATSVEPMPNPAPTTAKPRRHPDDERRARERRQQERRQSVVEALRTELRDVRAQVDANSRNLAIQFERIAQIQAELDRVLRTLPPRFQP
jgi:hypothetical protein